MPVFDDVTPIHAVSLKRGYLSREIAKHFENRKGFDGRFEEDERVIVRGGFRNQEEKIILAQPVTSLKLLRAQVEGARLTSTDQAKA
ncbi:hypothetical protein NCC49_000973 [Naganishia albida]|nr:hypothetical protein NCC49_000973 [Naganishia albida]